MEDGPPEIQFSVSGNLAGLIRLIGIVRGEDPALASAIANLENAVQAVEALAVPPPSLKE